MDNSIISRQEFCFLKDTRLREALVASNPPFAVMHSGSRWEDKQLLDKLLWRAHIVTWAANQALCSDSEGSFVELGVWYGFLSSTILNYTNFANSNRKFYLFDSWGSADLANHTDYEKDIYADVSDSFSKWDCVELIRGMVPNTLDEKNLEKIGKISYLSVDMNGVIPEISASELLYDRIVPGGVVYFDDYGDKDLRIALQNSFLRKENLFLNCLLRLAL